jgi:hypothetical protein
LTGTAPSAAGVFRPERRSATWVSPAPPPTLAVFFSASVAPASGLASFDFSPSLPAPSVFLVASSPPFRAGAAATPRRAVSALPAFSALASEAASLPAWSSLVFSPFLPLSAKAASLPEAVFSLVFVVLAGLPSAAWALARKAAKSPSGPEPVLSAFVGPFRVSAGASAASPFRSLDAPFWPSFRAWMESRGCPSAWMRGAVVCACRARSFRFPRYGGWTGARLFTGASPASPPSSSGSSPNDPRA